MKKPLPESTRKKAIEKLKLGVPASRVARELRVPYWKIYTLKVAVDGGME